MNIDSQNIFCQEETLLSALTDACEIPTPENWHPLPIFAPPEICIHEMFEQQVERSPQSIAVVFEDTKLTYEQLNQRANQLAHHLRSLGVGPEVLVGIYLERSWEMVVGILGILKAGGAYVPLNPADPPERIALILADTQMQIIVSQAQLAQNFHNYLGKLVCVDLDSQIIAQHSSDNPRHRTTTEQLIYVIYTSGSTGQPKGVLICHRNICNQLYWRQNTFKLTPTDKVLQTIALSFDPSVWQIFWPLCFGAQLIIPRPGGTQDSAYLVEVIAQQQITVIALVPSMLRAILLEKGIEDCQCLRHLSCGGEALPTELVERFFERLKKDNVLHNVYGPTEAAIDASYWTCERGFHQAIAPIGRAISNAEIYLLDEQLQPVAIGEPGELHIGGSGLARGYLNRPQLTAQKFIPHPFSNDPNARLYKTGDYGRYLADGNIEFLGRLDMQVKIRGFRIELTEIEAVLLQHPHVENTVVIAQKDVVGCQRLVAYVVPQREHPPTITQLRDYLKQKLASYMMPGTFVFLETMPLNHNGKIDRRALPAPPQTRPDLQTVFVPPTDKIQLQLTEIWQEVLGIEPIGIKDNFFDLGGHSLVALPLIAQIEQVFGKSFPLSTFLQAPTIEQLAQILQQEQSPDIWSILVPIQTQGDKLPLFCIHGADGNIIIFEKLVHHLGKDQPIYGLQPQGWDGKQPLHTRIEEMAAAYIREIRTVQPTGPYLLSGYSSGGIIAFEMAHQLQQQGEEVALLALLNSYCPIYFQLSFSRWLSLRSRYFLKMKWRERLNFLYVTIKRRLENISQWFERMAPHNFFQKNQQLLSTSTPNKAASIAEAIFTSQKDAVLNYVGQVYSGNVVLFRTQEFPWSTANDLELGWKELVAGKLEVYNIPGDHHNLVRANIQKLGEKLKATLTQATSLNQSTEV